ncbi:MAG: Yellowstone lake phycodnavirus 3 [Pseudomonadota bacterium]|jgi:hypothetical protein
MANAPSDSTYILVTPDSSNLPESRTLTADPFISQIQVVDGGPAGTIDIQPTLTLKSVTELNSAGLVAYDGTFTVTPRTLTSINTLDITHGDGLTANPILDVIDDTSIQKVSIKLNNGAVVGSRSQLNLINGIGTSITAVDNAGNNAIDITISSFNAPDVGSFLLTSTILGHSANLGLLTSGILKIGVSGQIASPSTATPNIDYLVPTTSLIQLGALNPSVSGSLIYTNASSFNLLSPGVSTSVLTMQTGLPTWVTPTASTTQLSTCVAAQGRLIGATGSSWTTIAPGGAGTVLTMSGGNTVWATPTVSATTTVLCQTATNLPPAGINLSAAGATLTIGTSSTGNVLHLENSPPTTQTLIRGVSNNASVLFDINAYSGNAGSQGTNIISYRSHRGTQGSPVAVANSDTLSDIQTFGYYTGGYNLATAIRSQAEENYTSTTGRTALRIWTNNDNNVLTQHLSVTGHGALVSTPSTLNGVNDSIYVQNWSGAIAVNGIKQTIRPTATSSPSLALSSSIDNSGGNSGLGGIALETFVGTSNFGPVIDFNTCSGSAASPAVLTAGTRLGTIKWSGCSSAGGPTYTTGGFLEVVSVGSYSASQTTGMVFGTRTSGTVNEMRWGFGYLVIGSQIPPSTQQLQLTSTTGYNPVSTTWTTTSDARIKQNIADIENGLQIVQALQPRTFNFTDERVNCIKELGNGECSFTSETKFYGFIAQEVEAIVPEAVTDTGTNIGSVENVKDINTHVLNIILFKAVKELAAKVAELEAKISG